MAEIGTLVDQLSKLTVMEVAELVKKLEESWGVSRIGGLMVLDSVHD